MAGLTFPHPLRITADPAWGWAGGLRHPPEADYSAGMFTQQQLREMAGDAALTLSVLDDAGNVIEVVPRLPVEGSEEPVAPVAPVTPVATPPACGAGKKKPG